MEILKIEQELREKLLSGTRDHPGKEPGRDQSGSGVLYHGEKREQPEPHLCRRRGGNPHTGL